MKSDKLDHAPLVEAWLKEPIWLPEVDTARTAQLVHLTPQQHPWRRPFTTRRSFTMFTATKILGAGVVLAAFGGFLFSAGLLTPQYSDNLRAAATASPAPSAAPAEASPEASPQSETPPTAEPVAADALVMSASSQQGAAGWTEIGRVSASPAKNTHYAEMRHLQAIGDRLVAIGTYHSPDTGKGDHDAIFSSLDGITWVPAAMPGDEPTISDLATTSDGLVAAGSDTIDGAQVPRIWSSADGVDWTELDAPAELKRVDQTVSAEAPLAVLGGQQLWTNDDGAWTFVTKLVNMSIAKGPDGYLAWQFADVATMLHSADLTSWNEVGLPRKVSKGGANLLVDTQVFALDDQWILLPHVVTSPDVMYTSVDGIEWTEAPRPPGIIAGAVQWMADIDGQVQAFGAVDGDDTDAAGIWTLTPGEPVADPEIMGDAADLIAPPIAFGDGYAATGLYMGSGSELTSWERSSGATE
jgi:hypothetical protein